MRVIPWRIAPASGVLAESLVSWVPSHASRSSRSGRALAWRIRTRSSGGWRHGIVGQFRQSVFGRLGGYDDVNDANRLGRDPAMWWIIGGQAVTKQFTVKNAKPVARAYLFGVR